MREFGYELSLRGVSRAFNQGVFYYSAGLFDHKAKKRKPDCTWREQSGCITAKGCARWLSTALEAHGNETCARKTGERGARADDKRGVACSGKRFAGVRGRRLQGSDIGEHEG